MPYERRKGTKDNLESVGLGIGWMLGLSVGLGYRQRRMESRNQLASALP